MENSCGLASAIISASSNGSSIACMDALAEKKLLSAGLKDVDWRGLDFPVEKFEELQKVDRAAWKREVIDHEELFILLHAHLPPELVYERELLICRL